MRQLQPHAVPYSTWAGSRQRGLHEVGLSKVSVANRLHPVAMLRLLSGVVWLATTWLSVEGASSSSSSSSSSSVPTIAPSSAPPLNDDMRQILRKVGSVPCSEAVRSRMYALLYEKNMGLHDQCFRDCKYQFFPVSQEKATPEQIVAAARSDACVNLFSGVILANFPECDVDFVSTRSCAEILMRIKRDIDDRRAAPTQQQFYEFYNLNRVINLLNENASLIEDAFRNSSTSISLWEMTKMMNSIYVSPDVTLEDDMTILVDGAEPVEGGSKMKKGSATSKEDPEKSDSVATADDATSSRVQSRGSSSNASKPELPAIKEAMRSSSAAAGFSHFNPVVAATLGLTAAALSYL